jgi:hypothetical protein
MIADNYFLSNCLKCANIATAATAATAATPLAFGMGDHAGTRMLLDHLTH